MKKWLLREQPQEKLDLRLWQTFRNIDLQTAIKLHEGTSNAKQTGASHSPQLLALVNPGNVNNRKASILPFMYVRSGRSMFKFPCSASLTSNDDLIIVPSNDNELSSAVRSDNMKDLLQTTMHDTRRRVGGH